MADDILSLETKETQVTPSVADEVKNALAELVGEGKKFKDEEALAKSKLAADQHIAQVHEENKGMRETIEELQEQLRVSKTKTELDALRNELSQRKSEQEPKEVTPPQLATDDLESMIEQYVTARETKATAQANLNQTNQALVQHYGDPEKAQEAVAKRAVELGMSVSDLTQMAAKSPSAVMALLAQQGNTNSQSIDKSSTFRDVPAAVAGVSVKAELDKLRRDNPKEYWSPAVQNKITQLYAEGKYN